VRLNITTGGSSESRNADGVWIGKRGAAGSQRSRNRRDGLCPAAPLHPEPREPAPRILARGAVVSELAGFHPPERWCFIASQRIIAALACVIVLVEAGGYSCARLTIQIAVELGRDVAVVPWRITDPGGPCMLELLRDGAHPVSCAQDVLELIRGEQVRAIAA
jgi:predicted Rossmann fold nucleotide-binding protein DprA/Smf involved in DNA uptake